MKIIKSTRLIAFLIFFIVLAVGAWILTSRDDGTATTRDDAQASQGSPPAAAEAPTTQDSPSPPHASHQSTEPSSASSSGRRAAVAAAVEFVTAWLDQDAEGWWQRLEPLMTTEAGEVYASVDPDSIPPGHAVRPGQERYLDGSTRSCRVEVGTTEGIYVVTLLRTGQDAPWRVERLDQPGS